VEDARRAEGWSARWKRNGDPKLARLEGTSTVKRYSFKSAVSREYAGRVFAWGFGSEARRWNLRRQIQFGMKLTF